MPPSIRLPLVLTGLLLALPTALGPGCASGPRTTETSSSFAPAIEAANRTLEERFQTGDLLGIADLYADDAVLISSESRTAGREAIDAHWSNFTDPVDWRLETTEVGGTEALAYELGHSELTRRRDSANHTFVSDYMRVWKKDAAGDWKISIESYW